MLSTPLPSPNFLLFTRGREINIQLQRRAPELINIAHGIVGGLLPRSEERT